jgi:hypothetical protein
VLSITKQHHPRQGKSNDLAESVSLSPVAQRALNLQQRSCIAVGRGSAHLCEKGTMDVRLSATQLPWAFSDIIHKS